MQEFASFAQLSDMAEKHFLEKCLVSQGHSCGVCLKQCPVFLESRFGFVEGEPATVMEKIVDLLRGGRPSSEVYILTYACMHTCSTVACMPACPVGLNIGGVFTAAAQRLQAAGMELPPLHYQCPGMHHYDFGHVFGDLQVRRSEAPWLTRVPAEPAPVDVVLFVSCISQGFPHLVLETVDILSRMGVNFVALGDRDLCCGIIRYTLGDIEGAQKAAEKYVSAMAKFCAKRVISVCPTCSVSGSRVLPRLFPVPFESQHVTEFLADNLDALQFTEQLDKVVTVHDSCAARATQRWDAPRKLLQAIPGITLVEMAHNQKDCICCGGLSTIMYPEGMKDLRFAVAEEARSAGADAIATICPNCQASFCPLEEVYPFEVKHTISVVAEAMGIHHEDKLKRYLLTKDPSKILAEARDCVEASELSLVEWEHLLPAHLRRLCIGRYE